MFLLCLWRVFKSSTNRTASIVKAVLLGSKLRSRFVPVSITNLRILLKNSYISGLSLSHQKKESSRLNFSEISAGNTARHPDSW